MPTAPALTEMGDEQQATAVLVVALGATQVRGGAAAVRHLAIERAIQDHPELDGRLRVADGVGQQLADDELGREGDLREAPGRELAGGPGPRFGRERCHNPAYDRLMDLYAVRERRGG